MATQTPKQPTPQDLQNQQYRTLTRNLSLALLVICPAIALLPPRRLNLYTFGLITFWGVSANHLTKDRTGRSVVERVYGIGSDGMPTEKAREMQRLLREQRRNDLNGGKEKGVLEKLWLGGEGEDWKEKRLREEREALERGEGYGDLIMDQIAEIWRGKGKGQGEKEGENGGEKE